MIWILHVPESMFNFRLAIVSSDYLLTCPFMPVSHDNPEAEFFFNTLQLLLVNLVVQIVFSISCFNKFPFQYIFQELTCYNGFDLFLHILPVAFFPFWICK